MILANIFFFSKKIYIFFLIKFFDFQKVCTNLI